MMKILVAVKRVIDYNVQIRVKSDGSGVETENVKMSMNPPDENAVEEALRIKESGKAEEVIVLSIGNEKSQETIRTGLAMGADKGIFVKANDNCEPLSIAKIMKKIIEKEKPQIVLMGKQAIDDDCNQTGQMLSALVEWPQATFASKLEIKDSTLFVTREIDEGLEKIEINLPAVITCDLRLNEPRYASLPNIMKAKKKPIETLSAEDLEIDTSPRIKLIKVEEPSKRKKGIMVNNVSELVQKLKHEAKVI
ncbi:MAG: Electron transfer flavoprotein subunit beta [Alphaproteobacteria bacterium MarineAlpha5_Bin9]|nr:MAG: Electron transfer flavoprotein subunit beta [Alphaproteobacteria bacterium MarineAlpha5_Bin9]